MMRSWTMLGLLLAGACFPCAAGDMAEFQLRKVVDAAEWMKTAWTQAAPLPGSFIAEDGAVAAEKTELRMAWTDDALLVAIRCFEKGMAGRVATCDPSHRDQPIPDKDDCVELLLDLTHDQAKAFGIAVNPKGAVLDALYYSCDYANRRWDSGASPVARIDADSWTVVMEIPFKSLGVKLSAGDTIGLAVNRLRRNTDKPQQSIWPLNRTMFSWWQRRRIPHPFFFAPVVLASGNEGLALESWSRGALAQGAPPSANSFSGCLINPGSTPKRVKVEAFQPDRKRTSGMFHQMANFFRTLVFLDRKNEDSVLYEKEFAVPAGQRVPVWFSYGSELTGLTVTATDLETGAVFYENIAERTFELPPRITDIGGEYVPELVVAADTPPAANGFLVYAHQLKGPEGANQYAAAMGMEYSLGAAMAEVAAARQLPNMTVRKDTDYNNLAKHAPAMRKLGAKSLFYAYPEEGILQRYGELENCPYLVNVSPEGKGRAKWDYRPLPCDAFVEDSLKAMESGLAQYGDVIYGVNMPDELDAQIQKGLRVGFASPEAVARYPLAREIDTAIRTRFGAGKYGLANDKTPAEDVPYCKIATQRFINAWVTAFTQKTANRLRQVKPGMPLFSDDPQGQVFPYDYAARWRPADVILHQTHDKPMPQDIGTSVITKFVSDVTGHKEFWPCIHIEGAVVANLDEMREVMSRAFRNGATGVSFFNLAWDGSFGRWDSGGAPDRWEYLKQIAAFYGQGHRAKIPEKADVGAFFSGYSTMTDYARGIGAIYNYLGPASGAYFKFLDGFAVERGEADPAAFKVVFVTFAEYESPAAARALLAAVKEKGVTLVVTDSAAFSHDLVGGILPERRELLGDLDFDGKVRSGNVSGTAAGPFKAIGTMRVERAYPFAKVPEDARPLLVFGDGTVACAERPLGKGRVIWFGFNPFQGISTMTLNPDMPTGFDYGDKPIADPLLVQSDPAKETFFKLLLGSLGVPLDEKIWTLKLPAPERSLAWPTDPCLSGNSLVWSCGRPMPSMNIRPQGRYRCSLAPLKDEAPGQDGWVAFAQGRLTDRIGHLVATRRDDDAVLRWQDTAAFGVEIDLGFAAKIKTVDLFLAEEVPSCSLATSVDGVVWAPAASLAAAGPVEGVRKVGLSADSRNCRFLRVEFGARPQGKAMTLAELDVWGMERE